MDKTTRIFEKAIELVGTLPESQYVFITGAHPQWLKRLMMEFHAEGLEGVRIVSIHEILDGHLRGRKGRLLIDDVGDLTLNQRDRLWEEQRILEVSSNYR